MTATLLNILKLRMARHNYPTVIPTFAFLKTIIRPNYEHRVKI